MTSKERRRSSSVHQRPRKSTKSLEPPSPSWGIRFGGSAVPIAVLSGASALLVSALYFRLQISAIFVPWNSEGDLTFAYALAKSDRDFGILGTNTDLGFPGTFDQSQFPIADVLWRLVITALSWLTDSPIAGVNLFMWLSFGLVAAVAYLWFFSVSSSVLVSFPLSLVTALLPWHFARVTGHVFLANYSSLLALLFVTSWVLAGTFDRDPTRPSVVRLDKVRYFAALVVAMLAGMGGAYYVIFYALMLAPLLTFRLLCHPRVRELYRSVMLALVPVVTLGVALLLIRASGTTTLAAGAPPLRIPEESQMYGGALFTLLIPDSGPLSPTMNQLLSNSPDIVLESMAFEGNAFVSPLAALAMWVAITLMAIRLVPNLSSKLDRFLSTFNWWPAYLFIGLLFFSTTGLGTVAAEYVSPMIRAWGRMSILLVVVALTMLAILASQALKNSSLLLRTIVILTLVTGLTVTVLDAVRGPLPVSTTSSAAFGDELTKYGQELDRALPKGCPVVPLPWLDFPESPPIVDMPDYSHFLPYLFADNPRWVYGYHKYADNYPVDLGVLRSSDASKIVGESRRLGLCAIQLDSLGFADDGILSALTKEIGEPLVVSTTGRWRLFLIPD